MLDQVREVITRLISAGHWRQGDPDILVVFDAGCDVTRLACLLWRCSPMLMPPPSWRIWPPRVS